MPGINNMAWRLFLVAMGFWILPDGATAAEIQSSKDYRLSVETIVSGLDHPWGLARLPNGDLLVSERRGLLWMIRGGKKYGPVAGLPEISAGGQGGLLDVVLDPDFGSNRTVYLSFTQANGARRGTAIASGQLSNTLPAELTNTKILFSMAKKTGIGRHFGSRIAIARDKTLFFTIGDRGKRHRAQDPFDHAGAVLRITRDGGIPADNPYADGKSALAQIWAKGLRNAQGAAINPDTGELWTVEHGARGGDEINRPKAGRNYGWPIISYGVHYSGAKIGEGTQKQGYEQPVYYWDPSIAPSGLAFYDGDLFAKWQGNLLVGALKDRKLVRLTLEGGKVVGEESLLVGAYGRIRDVRVFDDGAIWLLNDEADGRILRVTPVR